MKTPIAFVCDIWRRRFGWDEPERTSSTAAPSVTVTFYGPFTGDTVREAILNRSTESKEQ